MSSSTSAAASGVGLPRRIPIRVDPQPGEALDSWLEALAARLEATFGELLDALGLRAAAARCGVAVRERAWFAAVTDDEARVLGAATATPAASWPAMTMAGTAVLAGEYTVLDRATAHRDGWRAGSWFCPACLAENGGRWSLRWRLGWVFACLHHRCLLVAACPACAAAPQLGAPRLADVPTPTACRARAVTPCSPRQVCGAALTEATAMALPDDDPALHAAQRIEDLLTGWLPARYAARGLSVASVFDDLRVLASLALRSEWIPELRRTASPTLRRAFDDPDRHGAPPPQRISYGRHGSPRPEHAAAALSAALEALTDPDAALGAATMRWIVDPAHAWQDRPLVPAYDWNDRPIPRSATLRDTPEPSPVLADLIGTAGQCAPLLASLRCRSFTSSPSRPIPRPDLGTRRLAYLPMLLPRHRAAALTANPPPLLADQPHLLRWALAGAVALVSSRSSIDDVADEIGASLEGWALSEALEALEHTSLSAIGLCRLADHLTHHQGIRVDYRRRRQLDLTDPIRAADQAPLHAAFGGDPLPQAQRLVYELVTGNDPSLAPPAYAITTTAQRHGYERFAARAGAERVGHLLARRLLARHGLAAEPLQIDPTDTDPWAGHRDVTRELPLPENVETVLAETFGPDRMPYVRRLIYELVGERDPELAPRPDREWHHFWAPATGPGYQHFRENHLSERLFGKLATRTAAGLRRLDDTPSPDTAAARGGVEGAAQEPSSRVGLVSA